MPPEPEWISPVNVSEGRNRPFVQRLAERCRPALLDLHSDADHNRSVVTLGGPATETALLGLIDMAVDGLNITGHRGVHPRLGVIDVVPLVVETAQQLEVVRARRLALARYLVEAHGVPVFFYGPERQLPAVRREAFKSLLPDLGPSRPHPSAGATCIGIRPPLVAWNLLVTGISAAAARHTAARLRRPELRCLSFEVGGGIQLSFNLVDPTVVTPAEVYDSARAELTALRAGILRAELVGLVPAATLAVIDRRRWAELDLSEDRTFEARLARVERARSSDCFSQSGQAEGPP